MALTRDYKLESAKLPYIKFVFLYMKRCRPDNRRLFYFRGKKRAITRVLILANQPFSHCLSNAK
jgi:hypothetical protein